jgi:hypothetical protein
MRCLTACSSLDRHLHMIAYESLEKLFSARDEKEFMPKRRTGAETPSQTLSEPAGLCPGGGLRQIHEKELPQIKTRLYRYDLDHERE